MGKYFLKVAKKIFSRERANYNNKIEKKIS
jgi:hypothetical protein